MLVLVGAMMMGESTHIDWSSMMTAVPAFLTIVIQPFTFSIANGIYAGLVMSILLYLLTGSFLEWFGCGPALDAEDDLETPFIGSPEMQQEYEQQQAAHHGNGTGADGIPIDGMSPTLRRSGSRNVPMGGLPVGSQGARGTPYERGSFTMYINTFGSHTASPGRGLLGSQQASHMGSEDPEHSPMPIGS